MEKSREARAWTRQDVSDGGVGPSRCYTPAIMCGKIVVSIALATLLTLSGEWKLIKRYEGPTFELFNLANDIGERRNLADQEAALVEKLDTELMAHLATVGARLPRANPNSQAKKNR